jgi:hypothetical protein
LRSTLKQAIAVNSQRDLFVIFISFLSFSLPQPGARGLRTAWTPRAFDPRPWHGSARLISRLIIRQLLLPSSFSSRSRIADHSRSDYPGRLTGWFTMTRWWNVTRRPFQRLNVRHDCRSYRSHDAELTWRRVLLSFTSTADWFRMRRRKRYASLLGTTATSSQRNASAYAIGEKGNPMDPSAAGRLVSRRLFAINCWGNDCLVIVYDLPICIHDLERHTSDRWVNVWVGVRWHLFSTHARIRARGYFIIKD